MKRTFDEMCSLLLAAPLDLEDLLMPKMHQSPYRATVKEGDVGDQVWVTFELQEGIGIPEFDSGATTVSITFPPGTDLNEAKALARVLNAKGLRLSITK